LALGSWLLGFGFGFGFIYGFVTSPLSNETRFGLACGAEGRNQSKHGAGAPAAAQHPLLGLTCGAKGIKRIGESVPSPLGVLLSLPNFLGLRRSTHFGLACGTEGRKQSKRIGG
jgi:hypothetical protein